MASTISYASGRVTISGPYKSFTGSASGTTVTFTSGEAPAAGDAYRYLLWQRGGTSNTGLWEVRRIVSATSTTITVHEAWTAPPSAGSTFRISNTINDVLAAQPSAVTKTGDQSYVVAGDLNLTANAFFSSADQAIEWRFSRPDAFTMGDGSVLNVGTLWGGERTGRETTNGSRWGVNRNTGTGNTNLYDSTGNSLLRLGGPVINFFGALIDSRHSDAPSDTNFLFQRFNGPARMIGCVSDGQMGGRFMHPSSELVDCRFSGNDNLVPAWSIGANFDRRIEGLNLFQNLCAFKNYQTFSGTLRNCTLFASNSTVFYVQGSVGSVIDFIDCTEFEDAKIGDAGSGVLNQFRSVSMVTTDSAGDPLSGVALRINDRYDATQGGVDVSAAGGALPEVLVLRRRWADASPSLTFSPYRIRLRAYGYLWADLLADIKDPIKQSYAMLQDAAVVQSAPTAAAHTGISVTDHGGSPVAWQGKTWGISVVCDTTNNPGLTVQDLQHHLHWALSQATTFAGKASGLHWHDLMPMTGSETQLGTYGAATKGVRVVDALGNPFPGVARMQADDGTYYVPPLTYTLTLAGFPVGSEVRIYDLDDLPAGSLGTELAGVESAPGASFSYSYGNSSFGNLVWLQVMAPGFVEYGQEVTLPAVNTTLSLILTPERND